MKIQISKNSKEAKTFITSDHENLNFCLGAPTVMTDDEFVMIMTRTLGTFSIVVQMALMTLNSPPTTIFLYEDINITLKLVGGNQ